MPDQRSQFELLIKTVADLSGVSQISNSLRTLEGQVSSFVATSKAALGAIGIGVTVRELNELGNSALKVREEFAAWVVQILSSRDGSQQLVNELTALNRELSETTGTSERSLRNIESQLALYGASAEQIKTLTHGILELAAARRLDAEQVALFVSRSLTGEDIALTRLGIHIDKTKSHVEQVFQLMEQLSHLPNIAETIEQASGGMGKLEIQTNRAKVALGDLINTVRIPFLTAFTGNLADAKTKIDSLTKSTDQAKDSELSWGETFAVIAATIGHTLSNVLNVFSALTNTARLLRDTIRELFIAVAVVVLNSVEKMVDGAIDKLRDLINFAANAARTISGGLINIDTSGVDRLAESIKSKIGGATNAVRKDLRDLSDAVSTDFEKAAAALQKSIDDMTKGGPKVLSPEFIAKVREQYRALFQTINTGVKPGGFFPGSDGANAAAAAAATDALAASRLRVSNATELYRVELERIKVLEDSGAISVARGDELRRQAAQQYIAQLQRVRAELLALQKTTVPGSKEWEALRHAILQTDVAYLKAIGDFSNASAFGKIRNQLIQLTNEWSDLGKQFGGFLTQQFQNFASTMGNAIGGLLFRTGNLKQAFAQLAQGFVSALATMLIQWVLTQTIMKALSAVFQTEQGATAQAAAAPVQAAWAPAAVNASIATFGAAALEGVAAYLAAFAVGVGLGGGIGGGLRKGGFTGEGRDDEPAGVVHRGEFVFSAPRVRALGRAALETLHGGISFARPYQGGGFVSASGASVGFDPKKLRIEVYNLTDYGDLQRRWAQSTAGRKILNDQRRKNR